MKYYCLFTGLGSGNIGDEAMMHGFLSEFLLPEGTPIDVWDNSATVLNQFPSRYSYINYQDEDTYKKLCLSADAVLLVGDTPVMEKWGLEWPLGALSSRLEFCHRNGIPCNAVGVGADSLENEEAIRLFKKGFSNIESWTVRSFRSRKNLIALGIDPLRIRVAADLAWLMPMNALNQKWAEDFLGNSGIDKDIPLIGVNVVNEIWKDRHASKKELAEALDGLVKSTGWQVAFFCNETREGDYFDREASLEVISMMKNRAVLVPNNYFTPQEMVSLLSCCHLTLSWRYHFTLFSYLAGTPSVSVIRGEKMQELLDDTGGEYIGRPEEVKSSMIVEKLMYAHEHIGEVKALQEAMLYIMKIRSRLNFSFIESRGHSIYTQKIEPKGKLASVDELRSERFVAFMKAINLFAKKNGLREITNWSKVWEYPWVWFSGLSSVNWPDTKLLDIGSELSPMPWFLASLGASVTLVESDPRWVPAWEHIRQETGLNIDWRIVADERLPFPDCYFDCVTSLSVIEHQNDKVMAVDETARVLKQDGLLALSFDICEPHMGMTFPEWNGKALTMKEFEELIWCHQRLNNSGRPPGWNKEDIPEFINWHLQSARHHNYTVGAAILTKKPTVPMDIKKILIPRFDTIGDIILLEGFLEALIKKFPDAEITLLVREGYDQLASLLPEGLRWMTTHLDPYRNLGDQDYEEISGFLDRIAGGSWDLLLTTTFSRTWLDDAIASKLKDTEKVAAGVEKEFDERLKRLYENLKLNCEMPYNRVVPVDELMHETEKYQILWNNLFHDKGELSFPRLNVTGEFDDRAGKILMELGLEEKKYFVCAPAGTHNVPIKFWPVERFAESISWIKREFGFQPLLVCHKSEKVAVEALAKVLEDMGIYSSTWIGTDGEIPVLAALTKKSLFYFGNDTGPLHIATALGIPVVGIYGGGTWPRFLPVGAKSAAVVGELPCFGCGWDCVFEDAPCLRLIEVDDIKNAIITILKNGSSGTNIVHAEKKVSDETAQYISKIVTKFKMLKIYEADRAARLEAIHDRDRKIQEIEADRAARLEAIHDRDRKIQKLYGDIEHVKAAVPLVSVITPVFNGARWIENCIQSVLQQDYPMIEHIIVDGGSTDGTLDICRKYPHLIVHSQKDRGQSHAINKGFAIASGEILAWLCADDEYEAGAVEAAVKGILSGHNVVMGCSRFIDEWGNVIAEHPANVFLYYDYEMLLRFWQYNPLSQPAIFWTRKMWETCGPLRENLYFAMDYDLWLRMSQRTRFERVDAYTAKYRIHPDAKCFSDNYGSRIELIEVSRKYWPSRWRPGYWKLYFQYMLTGGAITQHYYDAEQLFTSAQEYLDKGKRLRAIISFVRAHLKHLAAPLMPEYLLVLKRILAEGIGPSWFWHFVRRVYDRANTKKEVSLVLIDANPENGDAAILKAESRGYRNPQFRFWARRDDEFVLLRDWGTESTYPLLEKSKDFREYGVHVRKGNKGDFVDEAWFKLKEDNKDAQNSPG